MAFPFNQVTSALNTFMGSSTSNDFDFNTAPTASTSRPMRPIAQRAGHSPDYVRSNGRSDGPSRQPGPITEISGPQSSNHYNSLSFPPKSTAPPHQASAPARASTPW